MLKGMHDPHNSSPSTRALSVASLTPMYSCRTCLALVIAPGRVTLFMLGIGHVRSVHVRQSTASCMYSHRGHTSCMARSTTSRNGRAIADQARYMLQGQEISADTD